MKYIITTIYKLRYMVLKSRIKFFSIYLSQIIIATNFKNYVIILSKVVREFGISPLITFT